MKYIWVLFAHFLPFSILATQTSLFWTNATTDVLETGKAFIEEDVYFTVYGKRGKHSTLPPDTGITVGVFTYHDLSAEASIDYLGGQDNPVYFSAKVGMKEGKLFEHSPSFSIGIYNAGTSGKTNQNVVDLVIGKELPEPVGGRIFLAGYTGNSSLGSDRSGFMVGYDHGFCEIEDKCTKEKYHKWVLVADYASGKNAIGGGGVGISYFFNKDIFLTTGPVWFNDVHRNGQWKWAVQIICIFGGEKS